MAYRKAVWMCRYALFMTVEQCHAANPGKSLRQVRRICRSFRDKIEEGDGADDDRPWAPPIVSRRRRSGAGIGDNEIAWLKRVVDDEPRLYHDEISQRLWQDHGVRMSPWNCARYMHLPIAKGGLGYTIKKLSRLACHKDFRERLEYLEVWLGFFRCFHHTALVLDESHGNESLGRRDRGWGPRGKRVYVFEDLVRDASFSLLAVADCNGFRPEMCFVTHEPVTSDLFYEYFRAYVLPQLRPFGEHGGILVLDNVGGRAIVCCALCADAPEPGDKLTGVVVCAAQHWDPRIEHLCEERGTMLVYLPRYSPEFSPIELAFGWLKKLLRRKRRQDAVRMSASQIANFVLGNLDKLPARKMRGFCRKCHWDVSRLAHTQATQRQSETMLLPILAAADEMF
jgi:hypothetical protein